ncbi:MAG: hypothetical protein PHV88_07185 [Eubacteriales bacterium]|nr:hypothetical protein [Eubacteriales bacterium]MDD4327755.1 hypothetical protein [Eubacteriales bacterium]
MRKSVRVMLALPALIVVLFVTGISVHADAGPKPSVTILVQNSGGEKYYLDLLVPFDGEYSNISEDEKDEYDPDMLGVLEEYESGGWYAALSRGTNVPLFGDLEGVEEDGVLRHRFSYIIPERFKVIIVDADLDVMISDEISPKVFNETIYLDYESMEMRRVEQGFLPYLKQFAGTFIPTIFIEGILLLVFGFSLRKNWKVFLLLNLVTQIILTVVMSLVLINFGLITSYFIFIPVEVVIILIEAVVLTKMLKEHRTSRRLIYALIANLASAAAGFVLIPYWFGNIFG